MFQVTLCLCTSWSNLMSRSEGLKLSALCLLPSESEKPKSRPFQVRVRSDRCCPKNQILKPVFKAF